MDVDGGAHLDPVVPRSGLQFVVQSVDEGDVVANCDDPQAVGWRHTIPWGLWNHWNRQCNPQNM